MIRLCGALFACLGVLACAAQIEEGESAANAIADDTSALISIANGLDIAVDAKDWEKARAFFAEDVRVDFSSLGGGDPATIPSDALIDGWRQALFTEKTSFHLRGNHIVDIDGDTAAMTSHGYAWNKLDALADQGGALWEVWGVYEYGFERIDGAWKLTAFAFRATHERGNPDVRTAPPVE